MVHARPSPIFFKFEQCEECPGKLSVENNLRAIFEEAVISTDNTISFYQWSHDDNRSSLISVQDTVDSFIERFSQKLDELSSHHYISKEQLKYLSNSKENLKNSECIALMDFAENYSVIIQDAIQSQHWSNTQCCSDSCCFVLVVRKPTRLDGPVKTGQGCAKADRQTDRPIENRPLVVRKPIRLDGPVKTGQGCAKADRLTDRQAQ
ncbi:hypothetical protein HELRODRAFT_182794 [Helobdella robusta]|uniref:Uncharacterized protein n=1 Tax=Helobdella robusta TaxID=6412 RepID=T1FIR2_HELRO|nr:hypothetical protein HELRODRAFT_182794 [Helobdella robusta]ESN90100.1 hypothetical protein HELRODRAFT_182794 [Helobdella robusta]